MASINGKVVSIAQEWQPTPVQYKKSLECLERVLTYKIAYLQMEERSGKTIPALLTAMYAGYTDILVISKKEALTGWVETLSKLTMFDGLNIELNTYQQAWKHTEYGINRMYKKTLSDIYDTAVLLSHQNVEDDIDAQYALAEQEYNARLHRLYRRKIVIFDEVHWGVSGFPYAGTRRDEAGNILQGNSDIWEACKECAKGLPILYLTATPAAEGIQKLFNQFGLSDYNPISLKNPYEWFRKWGIPSATFIGGGEKETYKNINPDALKEVNHLFVTGTREEAGHKYEPVNHPIYVEPSEETARWLSAVGANGIANINGFTIVADNISKERTVLHQLEGGTLKLNEEDSIETGETEKIDAIKAWLKAHSIDESDIAIMYNFVAEGRLLKRHFPRTTLKQASRVTGYNLYDKKVLFIYSSDYSATNHSQRTSRMCHKDRDSEINVYHLLFEGGISEQVYEAVIMKHMTFTASIYSKYKESRR